MKGISRYQRYIKITSDYSRNIKGRYSLSQGCACYGRPTVLSCKRFVAVTWGGIYSFMLMKMWCLILDAKRDMQNIWLLNPFYSEMDAGLVESVTKNPLDNTSVPLRVATYFYQSTLTYFLCFCSCCFLWLWPSSESVFQLFFRFGWEIYESISNALIQGYFS